MGYIVWPDEIRRDPQAAGGKAASLAALAFAGLPVPGWFAVKPSPSDTEALAGELRTALARLCTRGRRLAVRSSAAAEDGARCSFAGQFESFLSVELDDVADRVARVRASASAPRVLAYSREHGLPGVVPAPAVIVQRMIDADSSGVAFSADPVSGRRGIAVVAAVRGTAVALVEGATDGLTWRIDRDGRIVSRPADPFLDDRCVREVAALARRAERLFGRPQDVEWVTERGKVWIVQSRPITSLSGMPDPDGARRVWDNTNIVESYGGIVSPMTFSFARRVYEGVYRRFCRVVGVPSRVIESNSDVFRCMIGLVRGRVYYNLLNWYRVVAMLPGYGSNRTFFEQMLGVKEGLEANEAGALAAAIRPGRLRGALAVVRTVAGVVLQHFLLPLRVWRFRKRLDDALGRERPDYSLLRADELAACYRCLERKLLPNWDAPIVNDFFCMIFHGVLRRLALRWCGEGLNTALLASGGRLASIGPIRLVNAMGRSAAPDPKFVALLANGSVDEIVTALEKAPEFKRLYREYLDEYGDRCLEELKLESATLDENPLPLLRAAGRAALTGAHSSGENGTVCRGAEEAVARALRGHPVRRAIFAWVLANARARIRGREEMRLERTRVFGRVRRIVVELGRRLHAVDALADPRDVFYLEIEEVLGFIAGTATCTNLRALAALRKAEYAGLENLPAPAGRFETRGIVNHGHSYQPAARAEAAAGSRRTGTGSCPGRVSGCVRVVADPRREAPEPGEILVAERTDPGWIVVFPFAAGIIVEHGSVLSHTAIVAREMGIPTVVSLQGATRWLRTGDRVQLDGASGEVVKVAHVEQCA